jgi:hypothetical protein
VLMILCCRGFVVPRAVIDTFQSLETPFPFP